MKKEIKSIEISEGNRMSVIRIFPHSRKEFRSADELASWLQSGLRDRDGKYHLRNVGAGIGSTPPGSVVLFRFDKEIIGEAIVKQDVIEEEIVDSGYTYKGYIQFEQSSVRVYRGFLPIEFLEKASGRDLSVARPYYKIDDWGVYAKVIKEQVKRGGFL